MRWVATLAAVLLLASCTAGTYEAQTDPVHTSPDSMMVTCTWRAPTEGGAVELYELALSTGQTVVTNRTKIQVKVPADRRIRARVRGCNDEGCGPFSRWSPWFPARVDTLDMQDTPGDIRR